MIAEADHLYVYAGDNQTQWVQNLDANDALKLKVGEQLFDLTAERVTDQEEFSHFTELWLAKYGSDRTDAKVGENYLFRLAP